MKVELNFGALAPSVADQLRGQRLTATKDNLDHWERDRKAVIRLRVRGLMSDGTATQVSRRLMKRIVAEVHPVERGVK